MLLFYARPLAGVNSETMNFLGDSGFESAKSPSYGTDTQILFHPGFSAILSENARIRRQTFSLLAYLYLCLAVSLPS